MVPKLGGLGISGEFDNFDIKEMGELLQNCQPIALLVSCTSSSGGQFGHQLCSGILLIITIKYNCRILISSLRYFILYLWCPTGHVGGKRAGRWKGECPSAVR